MCSSDLRAAARRNAEGLSDAEVADLMRRRALTEADTTGGAMGYKKGGKTKAKKMVVTKTGGRVSSASKRADGIATKGNVYTGNIVITGITSNGITFADGTRQTTAASGTGLDSYARQTANAAFDKANTDFTNISATAGVYGSATIVPVITLTANGRLSTVTNTTIQSSTTSQVGLVQLNDTVSSVSTSQAATANSVNAVNNLALTDVTNVSVSAGTYGNATYVPAVTVAANGRITSISTTAVSAGATIGDVLALSIALG